MKTKIALMLLGLFLVSCSKKSNDFSNQTIEQLKSNIENKHPAAYYVLAIKLFETQKDKAILWFYIGQIRYRYYLAANPQLDPSGDPALFASFSSTIGKPLNEYAFGDIPKLSETLLQALAWDKSHANGFTPKNKNEGKYNKIRAGLEQMRLQILDQQESIKKQRKANGLKNRS